MMQLQNHLGLLLRTGRGLALKEVLGRTVRPGARVLDAGSGTGILAVWAALAGAGEVVGVDLGDPSIARALAEENGVADRVRFVQSELSDLDPREIGGHFDIITGLLYYNDPRRDEAQCQLSTRLHERFLAPGGVPIPDRVEYDAAGFQWPAQDFRARIGDLRIQQRSLETIYDLRLDAFFEAVRGAPLPSWFPARLEGGSIQKDGAVALSEKAPFASVEYRDGFAGYPATIDLEIVASGTLTTVVWEQKLVHGGLSIFWNESASWVHPPLEVRSGERVCLAIDDDWRRTNLLSTLRSDRGTR
jgi:SAM-dependent methyltransferase